MTDYRAVMRHVRYWRGAPHKWSTVYPLTGSMTSGDYGNVLFQLHALEQAILYPSPSGVGGGTWEAVLYDQASGGVPVAVLSYFDPDDVGSWVDYDGTAWPDRTHTLETVAEAAMSVDWLAGLSRSGKPVRFRKWYHAVPISSAAPGGQDIASGTRTTIAADIQAAFAVIAGFGVLMGNSSRLAAATPVVAPDYENHQMPRGRRRLVRTAARPASSFPPSLLVVPGSDGSLEA